jgi:preprotein translocase subunit YajC
MYYYALMNFGGAAAGSGASGSGSASGSGGVGMIIMLVAMFGIMYFMMIRPQKKKQKEEQAMRDNVQIGDEITTIGGIVGRVVTVKDDSLIIETGADRNKMKVMRWAVGTNNTANEKIEAERQAAKEAAEAEKLAKMEESKQKSEAKRKKSKKRDD